MKRSLLFALILAPLPVLPQAQEADPRLDTALSLAVMLQSARGVIGDHQELINDPDLGEKDLDGRRVLTEAIAAYLETTGEDPQQIEPDSLRSRLLAAQMDAIVEVIEDNQSTIDRAGVGFKGFVPAVFARLVNEAFHERVGDLAAVKVTAPAELVRNRKSRPDAWETEVIDMHFLDEAWPTGEVFQQATEVSGRGAYRVLVPEYYSEACLACHGMPAGTIDPTGYPMEGGALGDLGGVISITLFDAE